jgi:hypothetical protein
MAYEICQGDQINLIVVLLLLQYKTEAIDNHIKTKSLHVDIQTDYPAYESLISITESHQSIAQDLLPKGAFRQTLCVFITIDFNLEKER